MYLALAVIEAPSQPDDDARLREAIEAGRAPSDGLEHVCVELQDGCALVGLYLLGPDEQIATDRADQLVRRAAVSWAGSRAWRARCYAARPIGLAFLPELGG